MIYRRGREVIYRRGREVEKFETRSSSTTYKRQYIPARNPGYNEGLLEDKNQE